MSELHRAIDQLAKDTIFMSNLHLAKRLDEYQIVVNWQPPEEVIKAIITEMKIDWELGRLGGPLALQLLREITGENPDHYAYKDVGAGFVGITVHEAVEAWLKWYEEIELGDDEIPL